MKIGILSDTHNQRERTATAVSLLVEMGAEVLIHCGDLTHPTIVRECRICPAYFVLGNNDVDTAQAIQAEISRTPNATFLEWGREIELGGKRIAVTHGHLPHMVRELVAASPDYLLFGHSHRAEDRREGRLRRINPGALHRARPFSIALLDLKTDELRFLEISK